MISVLNIGRKLTGVKSVSVYDFQNSSTVLNNGLSGTCPFYPISITYKTFIIPQFSKFTHRFFPAYFFSTRYTFHKIVELIPQHINSTFSSILSIQTAQFGIPHAFVILRIRPGPIRGAPITSSNSP